MKDIIIMANNKIFPVRDVVLTLTEELNEHSRMDIDAMVDQEQYDLYVRYTAANTDFKIFFVNDENKEVPETLLFCGVSADISAKTSGVEENAVYRLHITLLSYTHLMDTEKINCSFQDNGMTYHEQSSIIAKRNGGDRLFHLGEGAKEVKLGNFILQYNETDWTFVKRMASHFYAPIAAIRTQAMPAFRYGIMELRNKGEFKNLAYTIKRDIFEYSKSKENNFIINITEQDFTTYNIYFETEELNILDLGDKVTYKGQELYVYKFNVVVKNYDFCYSYTLTTWNGLQKNRVTNPELKGLSCIGRVLDVQANKLKIHLIQIDETQDTATATWFPYASFYSTWYCMPEVSDLVYLHIPTVEDGSAYVINSIKQNPALGYPRKNSEAAPSNTNAKEKYEQRRQDSMSPSGVEMQKTPPVVFEEMANDPKVKLFTNIFGKTIALAEGYIAIQCNDGTFITLNDSLGIEIVTPNDINITSMNNILVKSEQKITVEAKEEIKLVSGESNIKIVPEEIKILSQDIKMN